MNQAVWNIAELRKLVTDIYGPGLLPRLNDYIDTLVWKKFTAWYHATKSKELWEELFKSAIINPADEKFWKIIDSSTAELEATAHSLYSIGDILGQVVNLTILDSIGFSEEECSLYRVIKKLKEQNIASDVLRLLVTFRDSIEFKYVADFCNTIKHRKLLDVEYYTHIDCTEKGVIEQGARLKNFKHGKDSFPATWFREIQEDYRVKIYGLLCDAGIGINAYLKNLNQSVGS